MIPDYDVGALSSQINASLSGESSWGFVVERSNGMLVGISSGEKLYDFDVARALDFSHSRLSAVSSRHSGIAAAAATLAAAGWPGGVHHHSTGSEFETKLLTVHDLDWLIVAGMEIHCEAWEVWRSAAGMCPYSGEEICNPKAFNLPLIMGSCMTSAFPGVGKACPGGTEPVAGLCVTCPAGHAGTDGRCAQCADGNTPNHDNTACVRCADGFAGTGGLCVVCEQSQQSSEDFTSCICGPGRYDSWCSVDSARQAIETGRSCERAAPIRSADPSCPCISYPWVSGAHPHNRTRRCLRCLDPF